MPQPTPTPSLQAQVQRVKEASRAWVKVPLAEKIDLLRTLRKRYRAIAEASVDAACQAKGIPPGHPLRGEEWLGGPVVTIRSLRLFEQSLRDIQRHGVPHIPPEHVSTLPDGRLCVKLYPLNVLESTLLLQTTGEVHLQAGITRENLAEHQAAFYRRPGHQGRLCVVLGAGNVNAIAPTDCLYKLFVEGTVCVLKMNPVNQYLGPFIEEAFRPLVEKGFLAVTYGGAEEGAFLVQHPDVDEVHITGSDKTHDALVWGPPGPERERRKAAKRPVLQKHISSELGNISPVVVVPGPYTGSDLAFQGRSVAGMVSQNASFNCVAAKLLVTPKGAPYRQELLGHIEAGLRESPPRTPWYPGAEERWTQLTQGRPGLRVVGAAQSGKLPWALIPDVDPQNAEDRVFTQEPWCAVLSETQLPGDGVAGFLDEAVTFLNTRVWGTLCAMLVVHPETLETPSTREAVEKAIRDLRYGSVCVNTWAGAVFGLGTPPWGGHPSSTLEDIQSGRGIAHNALMLDGVEKVVIRAPMRPLLRPPWWPGHRTLESVGRKLVDFEDEPSWLKLPALSAAAARA